MSYERENQPLPKIGPWKDQLDQLLQGYAGKSPRERLTLIRVYESDAVSAIPGAMTPFGATPRRGLKSKAPPPLKRLRR